MVGGFIIFNWAMREGGLFLIEWTLQEIGTRVMNYIDDRLEERKNKKKMIDDLSWNWDIWEAKQSLIEPDSKGSGVNPSTYSNNRLNEADLNQNVNPSNNPTNNKIREARNNGGGYVEGTGYVTADGRIYPTSNPDWVPGQNNGGGGSSGGGSGGGGSSSCQTTTTTNHRGQTITYTFCT